MNLKQVAADSFLDGLDPREFIIIKRARVNNLKNLSVAIPRNKLVVVTGLSGSGKSSLAFDTLFAEGQRMYVESLSSYARQFLGRLEKPDVDYIRGVAPAIAIEQRVNTRNPRSTVGTTTEVYDYLKLLFARVGKTISPVSGNEVTRDTVSDVVAKISTLPKKTRLMIAAPLKINRGRKLKNELEVLLNKGFTRILSGNQPHLIEDFLEQVLSKKNQSRDNALLILIDRIVMNEFNDDLNFRLTDSVQTAFYEGHEECVILVEGKGPLHFSERFELDGMTFTEPSANFFSFNNPYGACRTCEGFGRILGIDENLVIPDKSLSVFEGAIAPWRSEAMSRWLKPLLKNGISFDFPIHRPYMELTREQQELLWNGNDFFDGINDFFRFLESKLHKIQYRVMLSRYRGHTTCPDCKGTRVRKDAHFVKIAGKSIIDIVLMPLEEALRFVETLELPVHEQKIAERVLKEIKFRLTYLMDVGLSYLTLNRLTSTLSGGEFQRIKLATSLGSALVGSMYILDEPSIGLHPKDTDQMIGVLKSLRDLGNTVIVVEHDEEIMRAADQLIDIGPDAGIHGGELVFQGPSSELRGASGSHTADYLNGTEQIQVPAKRRKSREFISVVGARENNLKNLTIRFPLGAISVVTGVSGSGKSTLISRVLYPALVRALGDVGQVPGRFEKLAGALSSISAVEYVDQNPIGKTSRSNPVSYVKAFDAIRQLYADLPLSKQRGYKPAFFSFNVDGGRCDMCQGEGEIKVEMQFMADIYLKCESCSGKRFKKEILEIEYNGATIADVLDMTIEESLAFFKNRKVIVDKIQPLLDVGLGYIKLGQSSNSLSGGEAQRVKLASFLGRSSTREKIVFIFDEPTTGLHFHDIAKLLAALNALVGLGHTVIIIEHNLEVIKTADWIVDLGPAGGEKNGGYLQFEGTPEDMVQKSDGPTATYLKQKLIRITSSA